MTTKQDEWIAAPTGPVMRGYSQSWAVAQRSGNLIAGVFCDGEGGEEAAKRRALLIAAAPQMEIVVNMVIELIDPACTVESDTYSEDRARNERFADMLRAAWAVKAKVS